jgi:CRISPR type III-B/RAMP module-associated protein Cmr5
MTQTLEQRRAAHAWEIVEQVDKELGAEAKKKFGSPAKKLGPRILTAGLGPAVQFVIAKKEGPKLIEPWEAGCSKMAQRGSRNNRAHSKIAALAERSSRT